MRIVLTLYGGIIFIVLFVYYVLTAIMILIPSLLKEPSIIIQGYDIIGLLAYFDKYVIIITNVVLYILLYLFLHRSRISFYNTTFELYYKYRILLMLLASVFLIFFVPPFLVLLPFIKSIGELMEGIMEFLIEPFTSQMFFLYVVNLYISYKVGKIFVMMSKNEPDKDYLKLIGKAVFISCIFGGAEVLLSAYIILLLELLNSKDSFLGKRDNKIQNT